MANTLGQSISTGALIPTIIGRGAPVLREAAILPMYVNQDFGTEVAQKGDTIQVPISGPYSDPDDVVPGPTPPVPGDSALTTVPIPLNYWKKKNFFLTAADIKKIDANENFVPLQMQEAFRSLANYMNKTLFLQYKNIYGFTGAPGTAPFATDLSALGGVIQTLNTQLAPLEDRALILSPTAYANVSSLNAFVFLNTGDPTFARTGKIGFQRGFTWDQTTTVPTHTAGTITTGLIAKAATSQPVGTTAIVCTTASGSGACALVPGDILLFSGDSQTYVVTAAATQASAATDVTVNISPGKQVALVGSETVTVKSSHVVNLAIQRGALAMAIRPLAPTMEGFQTMPAGTISMTYTDPISGLSFRVDQIPGYEQLTFEVKVLFGVATIRPQFAARLAG